MDPILPDRYFATVPEELAGVILPDRPVWESLGLLKAFLQERVRPLPRGLPLTGGLCQRTCAIFDGRVLLDGFDVTSWDASKGKLAVEADGKPMEGASVVCAGASLMDDAIDIGPGVLIEPGAFVKGPAVLTGRCEVRQGAYLRGVAWIGEGGVVGHATEVKNAIFLPGAKAGHFAYVGDSVLGCDVNLGAGTKLANLKIVPGNVRVCGESGWIDTGRRKFGAILGDGTETGCNSVTSPGSLLGPKTMVYPNTTVPAGLHAGKRKRFK